MKRTIKVHHTLYGNVKITWYLHQNLGGNNLWKIIEINAYQNHIPLLVNILLKISVSGFIEYLKEKVVE